MSKTAATVYSEIAEGKLLSREGLLKKLNDGFEVDFGAEAGAVSVQLWDTWTTATPAAGTLATDKAHNQIYSLTLTSEETTMHRLPHQKNASFARPSAMRSGANQAADALYVKMQNQVITSLKAATAGLSIALSTGYIDFAIPSAATTPDMINELCAKMQRAVDYVRDNTRDSDDDLSIIGTTKALAQLRSACGRSLDFYKTFTREGNRRYFDGVECYPINTGTDFGGASNEAIFVINKKAFALKHSSPYVNGGGWMPGPDVVERWTLVVPYAYGMTETEFFAELTNPAS